jgi:putative peptide zinc metalloprotease protein
VDPVAKLADVPERPRLAPGVSLSGQVKDGGFDQRQYLAQRDGQFVQLTPLLYGALELADGRRGVEDIARELSARSGKRLGADDVRTLFAKVIPLGLVPTADGKVTAARPAAERSPLAVNMRVAIVPDGVANAIGSAFSLFFFPPVVVATVAAVIAAHVWLYLVHGVGQGIRDVVYTPALLIPVIGAYALSAGLHEIGHAAALRYGGGTVRKMGIGLYLVYPVVYTDVTDSYRLGKGARLRTDLGGFYFNGLFFLAMIGAYALTGAEAFLLIAALVDLEVIFQLMPLGRLDGYWILTDLTGVPDLFTYMAAFFRGLLPGQRPAVKLTPGSRAVFFVYTAVMIPLALLLIFLLVKGAPRIAASALESAGIQLEAARRGMTAGDAVAVAAAGLQVALLALQVAGLAMVLWKLVGAWTRLIGRINAGSPPRRAIGLATNAAAAALVIALWLPQIPLLGVPGPLRASARFEPLRPETRWTLPDAIGPLGPLARPLGWEAASSPPVASPTPAASAAPSATPTAAPTATATATAAASPAATGTLSPVMTAAPRTTAPAATTAPPSPTASPP